MGQFLDVPAPDVPKDQAAAVRTFAEGLDESPLRAAIIVLTQNADADTTTYVIGEHEQLSPNRAAKILKMSRTHLRKLLDTGVIPCVSVGSDRRIDMRDVVAFEAARHLERKKLAESLAHNSAVQDDAIDELVDQF